MSSSLSVSRKKSVAQSLDLVGTTGEFLYRVELFLRI